MSPRIFIGLILCNLVWSANPIMGKILLRSYTPAHAAFLRYGSALLAYLLFNWARHHWARGSFSKWRSFMRPVRIRDWGWLVGLGFFTFCFSPLLQLSGLNASRATDNSFIIAMEPLMTVLMAWVFLRERLKGYHFIAFVGALVGFGMLSGITLERLQGSWDAHLTGNLLMLGSLAGEALYSTFARKLMVRYLPTEIFGSGLLIGTIILGVVVFLHAGIPASSSFTTETALSLLWLGPLGTTITYLFWMVALSKASIPSIALTLFVQPVVGALWGWMLLDERLTQPQALGGLLILLAVSLPALADAVSARFKWA